MNNLSLFCYVLLPIYLSKVFFLLKDPKSILTANALISSDLVAIIFTFTVIILLSKIISKLAIHSLGLTKLKIPSIYGISIIFFTYLFIESPNLLNILYSNDTPSILISFFKQIVLILCSIFLSFQFTKVSTISLMQNKEISISNLAFFITAIFAFYISINLILMGLGLKFIF